jgi:hypothetical protein
MTEEYLKQLTEYYYERGSKKKKQQAKDPNLVIKEKKAKRKLAKASRKINQKFNKNNKFKK